MTWRTAQAPSAPTTRHATSRGVLWIAVLLAPGLRRTTTLASMVIVGVWLALMIGVFAQAHTAAYASSAPPSAFAGKSPTNTPTVTPTNTPSVTATPQVTATATPAGTGTPTDTPTDTPTVFVNSGTAAPQPTKLVLSQPTVGSGGGGLGGGVAGLGDNSMFIAVVLGCVTSVLGIIIGGVALLTLIRTGYGPFLRALLLGKRARAAGARAGGDANTRQGARGSRSARSGAGGEPGRRVGDGVLTYQETGDLGGGLWPDAAARQSARLPTTPRAPRDPRDPRRAREDDYAGHPPDGPADPYASGRGRAVRQPPRSDPRSRAGASRPPSRPVTRSRDGW